MDEAAREQLVARFRAYLETAATGAEEPDQAAAPDLFTLLAEVAALKAEVKVESRQVKAALDQFRELFDLLRQSHGRLEEELDRAREGRSWRAKRRSGICCSSCWSCATDSRPGSTSARVTARGGSRGAAGRGSSCAG
jgi:hypothetical protein